jgi:preprotein translocase subunit SecG
LAAVFFVCTMALSYFGNLRPTSSGSVLDGAAVVAPVPAAPAVPAGPAAQIPDNKTVTPAAPVAPAPVDASKPATQIPTK